MFNASSTILSALNSVFIQSFQPIEIIVVNDRSTDDSEQILAKINYPSVKVIEQENASVSATRNKGVIESADDWIAFLDADYI